MEDNCIKYTVVKDIMIPFDDNGQQHYPWEHAYGFHWKPNYTFTDTLYITNYTKGRSAAGFDLMGSTGIKYHMFLKDMIDLIHNNKIDNGNVRAEWTFIKRGMNYGITQYKNL